MSWDLFVGHIPAQYRSVSDIPDDFDPSPLGLRAELVDRIKKFVPRAKFRDPSWGTLSTPEFSVEFNMGESEHLVSFALHVRGGEEAAGFVSDLLSHLGLRAFDPGSQSGILDPGEASEEGLRRWRAYRDQIVR